MHNYKLEDISFESLAHELLQPHKCYLLECGAKMYVWMGRSTTLQERKAASEAAEKLLTDGRQTNSHVMKVIEGFEMVMFKSKFSEWPATPELKLSSEDGRGKVAALLKSQGLDVKGLMKNCACKEEPQPYIDCTGHLQIATFFNTPTLEMTRRNVLFLLAHRLAFTKGKNQFSSLSYFKVFKYLRVALALDTRILLLKTVLPMTLTLNLGLLFSEFKAQDQKTCKHFK